jgi:hypothetical protein
MLSSLLILAQETADDGGSGSGWFGAFFNWWNGLLLLGIIGLVIFWKVYKSKQM